MSQAEFIKEFSKLVFKYAGDYNVFVHSPIIAQGIKESGYGTSDKVFKDGVWRHNYLGLKWRDGRISFTNEFFSEWTWEEVNGERVEVESKFFKFNSMEDCVRGYFEWISGERYDSLRFTTKPEVYIKNLKESGYATDSKYVANLLDSVEEHNLTQYDTNSPLVDYIALSPHHSGLRKHDIDTETPHCVVGQVTVERLGDIFNGARKASSNYGIGSDGRIAMYVEEKNRAWTSSNADNDNRAVTTEIASDTTHPYGITEAAMNSYIRLSADIHRRNHMGSAKWEGDKSLIGNPSRQTYTVHRWFAAKACPGDYIFGKLPIITRRVNEILSGVKEEPMYRVIATKTVDCPAVAEILQMKLARLGMESFVEAVYPGQEPSYPVIERNPYPQPTRLLYYEDNEVNMTGEDVRWLQWELAKADCYLMDIDGEYGSGTHAAVLLFQKKYGLKVDGLAGPKTRLKLNEV